MKYKFPKIFYSKWFLGAVTLALIITGVVQWRQFQDRKQIDQEIAALQAQERELSEQNRQLEESIEFLSSEAYKEKLARLQLNLQKEGEIVVNFPPEGDQITKQENVTIEKSNPIKWWEFIFVN